MRIAKDPLLAALLFSTILAACGGSNDFPPSADTRPNAFSFTDQTNVATSSVITSAPVTITGISAPSPVSVTGGSYSVGCTATFVTAAGTINNNQTVCVRHTSSATASTATNTTLTVGGVSDTFTSTTAAATAGTTPAQFNFVDQTNVATSSVITSDPVTITGINAPSPVSVTGGSYSVGCTATFVTAAGTINNNETVCVRHTSSATASTATNTTLTVGGVSDTFTSTTAATASDTTPDPFSFTDQTDVATSTVITSAPVTITGINAPSPVSVTGGSYSVGCTATFVTAAGTINNNETVCVRHTSSATASTATNTTLTVGGVSDIFTSTTAATTSDTTPDQFSFTDQTNVAPNTVITSDPVTITGINAPSPVSVTGGSYSVGCTATFVTAAGTISNNETVCVRHTSSATASTATDTTLTVGGVSDTFTSTTAAPVATSRLLPFLTGTGDLRLFDPEAAVAAPNTNPRTVDTGLTPPPPSECTADLLVDDCFGKAKAFYSGTVSGSTVSNLGAIRLAYIKGGTVFRVDLTQDLDSSLALPTQISSVTDACRIVKSETTDFGSIDDSPVVVERPGPDGLCGQLGQFPSDPALEDNLTTVIRLNSTAADAGLNLPLVLTAGNPLHAQTDASGVITGFVSFERSGAELQLVRRNTDLASPTTLLQLGQTGGASLHAAGLTHLFVTAIPTDSGLTLFRVESNGTLSPELHFFGSASGNLIRDGLHDATHLYFSQDNQLLRIPLDSASSLAEPADVLTALDPTLRIIGAWALDTGSTPNRVVFEARDDSFTVLSGVFSVATTASGVTATTLANYPDSEGGSAVLVAATNGRAYINITNHGAPGEDALKINTDGTGEVIFAGMADGSGAYWPGTHRATSFDRVTDFAIPIRHIFLARHGVDLTDTLSVFDPATGLEGIQIGAIANTGDFQAVKIDGVGRYSLARAEIDRSGARDSDVYFIDAETAGSLIPLAETAGATDMPVGN